MPPATPDPQRSTPDNDLDAIVRRSRILARYLRDMRRHDLALAAEDIALVALRARCEPLDDDRLWDRIDSWLGR